MKNSLCIFFIVFLFLSGCRYSGPLLTGKKRVQNYYTDPRIDVSPNDSFHVDITHLRRQAKRFKYFSISTISLISRYTIEKDFNPDGILQRKTIMKSTPFRVHDPGALRREKTRMKTISYSPSGMIDSVEYYVMKCINYKYEVSERIIRFDSRGTKTEEKKPIVHFR